MTIALQTAPDTPRDEITITCVSPFLGAKVGNLSPALAEELRLDPIMQGVVIIDVQAGSLAQRLGFQHGDLIITVNNEKIAQDARSRACPVSSTGVWRVTILRGGRADVRHVRRMRGTMVARRKSQGRTLFAAAGWSAMRRARWPTGCGPASSSDVVGQDHLLGPDGALTRMLETRSLGSLVFWGPPGTGKTTVARLLAHATDLHFEQISAMFSGVADLKKVFEEARARRETGQGTLLFVDEIHRFNRAQQDSFLPVMEDGTIVLVGATTENPSFELNAALLSRARVLVFKSLDAAAIEKLSRARRGDRRQAAAARCGGARRARCAWPTATAALR